jgi:hypothetical protein
MSVVHKIGSLLRTNKKQNNSEKTKTLVLKINLNNKTAAISGAIFGSLLTLIVVDEITIYVLFGFCLAVCLIANNWREYGE